MDAVHRLLSVLAGPESLPLEDALWHALVASGAPLSKQDPLALDNAFLPCWTLLVTNTPATNNLQKLLQHSLKLLRACAKVNSSDAYQSATTAVCIVQSFVRCVAEKLDPERLQAFIDPIPEAADGSTSGVVSDVTLQLVRQVLQTLNDPLPSNGRAYALHTELLRLLVTMASTQLYTPAAAGPRGAHPFTELLLSQTDLMPPLVQTLLEHFVERQPPPRDAPLWAGSRADGRWGYLASMLRLSRSAPTGLAASPLAHASTLLLLILLHHTSVPRVPEPGPVARALSGLSDRDCDSGADAELGDGGACARVSFAALYDTFGRGCDEHAAMVLYALLRQAPAFLSYVLRRPDPDVLLLPILQQLYHTSALEANHMYMLLIVLLILSQDAGFAASVHRVEVASVPWYQERTVARCSLGSLLVVLLSRTAQYNLFKLKDAYLHTSTLAALTNLAPHFAGLSSLAAQRLMGLMELLAKHHARLADRVQQADGAANESAVVGLDMYADCLRMVLEVVNIAVSAALPHNPELVYQLLHRQDTIVALRAQPRFMELVENIQCVLDYFNPRLDQARDEHSADWTVERVRSVVKQELQHWKPDKLKQLPDLRFTYEEAAAPEEFFVPYVWSMVVAAGGPWNLRAIALFSPANAPHYAAQASGSGGSGPAVQP